MAQDMGGAPGAEAPQGGPRLLSMGSWEQVERLATDWLSRDAWRQAFRLVLAFRLDQPSPESASFLRRHFAECPFRFVVAMVQGIGNMVMLTPAVRALKAMFPLCAIEVVGHRPAIDVVDGWSLVEKATELDDFDPSVERDAVLLSMWSGEFQKRHPVLVASGDVPAVRVDFRSWLRHEAEFHLDLARALGYEGELLDPYCVARRAAWPFEDGGPVALLSDTSHPDPAWQRKRWPYFQELAAALLARGYQVGLIGGPLEADQFRPDEWPTGVVNLLGRYTIAETAYAIRRAGLLIANDSGPAHIGAAVGAQVYVLFGPTRESKNLPLGPHVRAVSSDFGCRPCQYLRSWEECARARCLDAVSVERVLAELEGRAGGAPADSTGDSERPATREDPVRVDLGCGRFKRKGFIGIDLSPQSAADVLADVTVGIPLATDSVEHLAADGLLHEVGDAFPRVMDEIWRVCKADARVEIALPVDASARQPCEADCERFRLIARHELDGEAELVLSPLKEVPRAEPPPAAASRPHVWFVTHNQPGAGGGEIALHHVANGLSRKGYAVTVFYTATPTIHRQPAKAPGDVCYEVRWLEGGDLPAVHRESTAAMRVSAEPGDVCLPLWRAASPELMEACREQGVCVGVWCQNVNYPPDRTNRSVFRLADFAVAVTPYALDVLRRRFDCSDNVFVIPNASSDLFFAGYHERDARELRRFVFVGRLEEAQKGLADLCDALGRVRDAGREFTIDVIGSGPDEELMRSQVGCLRLGERVRFLGWKQPDEVARMLPGYDLCVLPSKFEGCSLATIEVMAAGVPLITTTAGGTPWLIEHGKHGLLVQPGRPIQLAEAIEWACDHPAEMALMGRWAHRRALKRYHWGRVVRDYCTLLGRLQAAFAPPTGHRLAG